MIRRLEKSHDEVVGYSLAGEVTDDEYTQMASELRDDLARFGTIRLLFRLSDLSLSSFFSALDERIRFVKENQDQIERVAIVTDDTAAGVLSKAAESLGRIDIETFSQEDEAKAWAWLE
jgi:hypothetical protein